MKKYFLTLGLAAFFMTSCCGDKTENAEGCEQNCKEQHEQCEHHGEMPGMCHEMMAQTDKVLDLVANWEFIDEQQKADAIDLAKDLVAKRDAMKAEMEKQGGCQGNHEGCQGNHEGCQGNHEGCQGNHEGCQGNHEGCQGNHEGCQHQHEGCEHNK